MNIRFEFEPELSEQRRTRTRVVSGQAGCAKQEPNCPPLPIVAYGNGGQPGPRAGGDPSPLPSPSVSPLVPAVLLNRRASM